MHQAEKLSLEGIRRFVEAREGVRFERWNREQVAVAPFVWQVFRLFKQKDCSHLVVVAAVECESRFHRAPHNGINDIFRIS